MSTAPHGDASPPMPQTSGPRGVLPWAMGLIVLFPVPVIGALASGLTMLITGAVAREKGGIAAINGRNAANWGATYVVATVLLVPAHFVLLFLLTQDGPSTTFFPVGIPLTAWAVMSLVHLIGAVVGSLRAAKGRVFWLPAIPFFLSPPRD